MIKQKALIYVVSLVTIIVSVFVFDARVMAKKVDDKCTLVTAIFARGSGQGFNAKESLTFRTQLESRVDKKHLNFYELGSESYGGNQYPAVDVSNVWNGNAIGAKISGGMGNTYGKSVKEGVAELRTYLDIRHRKCPNEFFILGGVSQGAQVVGQALPNISSGVKNKIVFNMLFGDPKLYLPEGEGIFPPACRNENLSAYRREIANCHVDNGALGARKPFLPSEDNSKTGLWCLANDYVCGSSKFVWDVESHGK